MSKREAVLLITIVVVFIGGFVYYMKYIFKPAPKQPTEIRVANADSRPAQTADSQEWILPSALKEISANVFQDDIHMACIQDNDGVIYIYNLQSKSIDEQIQFAGNGDYEGLALVQNTWYVLRSDGFLYEVQPQKGKKPVVKTYDLPLELENETESLCYDSANNRLLIAVKEKDLQEKDRKGIYSFDLTTKQMGSNAIFYIESAVTTDDNEDKDKGDKGKKKKKGKSEIKPSDIALHPKSGDLYILDGPSSRLFITDANGNIRSRVQLDKKTFPQPEGLCFNKNGDLYISSEAGKNGQGVIVKFSPDTIQ
ncbi:MAG TPA: SdiA-regulated domain-containing protein [Niastella sp.]